MGRMVWIAVGAAGGVYAYRRGQRLLEQARERGLVGSMQAATGSAADAAGSASRLAAQARQLLVAPRPEPTIGSAGPTGSAAARALAEARRRPTTTPGKAD